MRFWIESAWTENPSSLRVMAPGKLALDAAGLRFLATIGKGFVEDVGDRIGEKTRGFVDPGGNTVMPAAELTA